jgi:small redox-active disulfide protein 2
MEIKVLGPGCARCHETYDLVMRVLAENTIEADVEFVTDPEEIAEAGIEATPAVVVGEKLVVSGRIPQKSEIEGWLVPGKEPDRWWAKKRQ